MAQHGISGRIGIAARPAAAPVIADKLYFRIGEVAQLCEVPAYVLRFWESEFPQLKPNKGGTGQRLYRRRDVEIALQIKKLLYDEGFTIAGARQTLKAGRQQKEPQLSLAIVDEASPLADRNALRRLQKEMRELLRLLSASPAKVIARQARAAKALPGSSSTPSGSDDLFN